MRERFRPADIRFLVVCFLLLAATVWFSAKFFYRAFPEASIDFRVTRNQARELAQKFLSAQGLHLSGYREAARFSFDDNAKTFLERELGLEQANRIMGERVRLWRWSHRWFRPQQKEEFRVDITPRGETAGFEHQIPEAAPGASLSSEQARALAEKFLREKIRRDPATLEFVEGSSVTRPARTDHVFTWKERDFNVKESTYRLEVMILGDRADGYREYLKIPDAWLRDYDRLRSRNQTTQSVDTVFMLLLAVGLLVTILLRVRSRDVRWGRAAVVGCVGAALFFLSSWNSQPLAEFGYPTTDSYPSFLARQFLQYLLGALASGGLLCVLTAGAEPLYRQYYGSRISLGNLFRPRGLRTKSFFLGAVLGLTLTGIFVAYQTAFYLLAYRWGAWSPADVPYSDLLNTRFPWLFVLLGGFLPAVSEEFLFRMFSVPFLSKLFRSTWAAVLLAGFIWGFGHAGYPQQPFYIRGVEVGIGGVALGLVMLRWGILPTLVWHYSVDALYTALLLLRSHNLYFVLSGAASAGIMVLPVLAAWIAYLRGPGFEPEAELTNQRETPAAAELEAPASALAPAPSLYPVWTGRRRLAALLILTAAIAFLKTPVVRFGDAPRFALNASQARTASDGFAADHGLPVRNFRTVAYPADNWDADVGKYFLERRPVSYLADAFERLAPLHAWRVRYYKPLDKEELRVSLHPESGKVFSFDHVLPEDQPGADLAGEAARNIAAGFLTTRGFALSTLELKETTSEKKKARHDHSFVWEAKPGEARNLEEARYRVRVEVAGDRVVSLQPFWKLPETFVRDRSRQPALANFLLLLRVLFAAALAVIGLWLLIDRTRKRQMRWRSALAIALPVAGLGILSAFSQFPVIFSFYNTAIPLETFEAQMVTGMMIAVISLFLGLALASGLLAALRPDGLSAFRRENRRRLGLDALLALGLALALAGFLGHFRWLLLDRFHRQALVSVSTPAVFAHALPAVSALASACNEALFGLAFLALAAHVTGSMLRSRWIAAAVALCAIAAPSQGHTAAEFFLQYSILLVDAAVLAAWCAWFGRKNYLAYALAAWSLALGRRAMEFLSQPNASLQQQGWLLVAVLALGLIWALAPAFGGRRQVDLAQMAARG